MCDPYLLGFEIVDKNEDNNRLVGFFAFRVSGELLMVPVFYLNGQIKGQDLIYRKPVNRFYPNTEKWVAYFVSKGVDGTDAHYTRGYSFIDKRAAEDLSTVIESSPISQTWSSVRTPGINRVADVDGTFRKVLWAPTTGGVSHHNHAPYGQSNRSGLQGEHRLVFLEGPDKGTVITYRHGTAGTELPLFVNYGEFEMKDAMDEVTGSSSPSVNRAYVVWLPELKMLFGEPIRISSSESSGDVTKLNFVKGSTTGARPPAASSCAGTSTPRARTICAAGRTDHFPGSSAATPSGSRWKPRILTSTACRRPRPSSATVRSSRPPASGR
ncbi:MAG: hypothetical protein ABIT37_02490 [Luteolibacter sp.]